MKNNQSYENYDIEQPLCAFSLSPPFFIRILSREKRCLAPSRRLDFPLSISSYSRARLSRYFRKKSSSLLQTVPGLFNHFKRRKHLNLEEILSTIQGAWKERTNTYLDVESEMEISPKKATSKEIFIPVLQRRRLSVPETIMRKHLLAQEKLNSHESKNYQWGNEVEYSSDPNLNRKKDSNIMRKSTLLRRLWGNTSKSKLSGSFQEWQHSSRKLSSTQSLNSTHSSPEHLPKNKWEFSPRRKPNLSFIKLSSKASNDEESLPVSPKRKNTLSKTPLSKESTVKYTGSSFTTCSDTNSDSAYTNSISNLSATSSTVRRSGEDENSNRLDVNSRLSNDSFHESGVQTKDVTNLNVISNVNLSQATLDVIFKEVMKDINKFTPGNISINSATVTRDDKSETIVKEVPSFFLNTNPQSSEMSSEKARIEKFLISNVRSGSSYGKPTENISSAVPRFSAVPRTSSMEVNTSEQDKEESDTASFADSLEDFTSPRGLIKSRRNSTDITQLLPEGRKSITPKKSSTFYIPIEVDKKEVRAVSELLPDRVREKLNERQQKREEKSKQFRSAFKTTDSISEIKSALNFQSYKPKKRIKPILPSIETLKNSSKDRKLHDNFKETSSRKRETKIIRNNISANQAQSVLYEESKKHDWLAESRKIYEKSTYENSGKKIEILEIVECISMPEKNQKSKIPLPINQTLTKKLDKPVYLDFENHVPDPKFDQLIANILIDSLNHDLESSLHESDKKNANFRPTNTKIVYESPKNSNNIGIIPEEVTSRQQKTSEGHNNNHVNINNNNNVNGSKDENETKLHGRLIGKKSVSSIPKGWVTFYNMHKDMGTPESTSDEGKKSLELNEDQKEVKMLRHNTAEHLRQSIRYNMPKNLTTTESNDISLYSSGDEQHANDIFNESFKKFGSYHRRRDSKAKYTEYEDRSSGKWSVTISGSNTYGQTAPDVEMKLKFPHINKHKHSSMNRHYSDSGLGEENLQDRNIPNIQQLHELERRFRKRDSVNENLPKIQTARSRKKKREYSVLSMVPSSMVPRQTKTSTSRYHLSRPRERYSLPDVPSMLNERQYCEILKRIPDILAVTGQSISPERRSIEDRY